MKVKVNLLLPNPFKKKIDGGKLNKNQVETLKQTLKDVGFFGSIPVIKREGKYYIVSGHHRVQAIKEFYGNDYEVEVNVKNYTDDELLKAMVIENLTQRSGEFREESQNILLIEKYLNSNPKVLKDCRESRQSLDKRSPLLSKRKDLQKATAQDISKWLDNETNTIMSHDYILNYLNIEHNLDNGLKKIIYKKHNKTKSEREDETLNQTQAGFLSLIKDKEEQKDLFKAIKKSREQRVRNQSALITEYKKSSDNIKNKIRLGELDIADINIAKHKEAVGEINLSRSKLAIEKSMELQESLEKATKDYSFIDNISTNELELTYHFILNWVRDDLRIMLKKIEKEMKKRGFDIDKKKVFFDFEGDI